MITTEERDKAIKVLSNAGFSENKIHQLLGISRRKVNNVMNKVADKDNTTEQPDIVFITNKSEQGSGQGYGQDFDKTIEMMKMVAPDHHSISYNEQDFLALVDRLNDEDYNLLLNCQRYGDAYEQWLRNWGEENYKQYTAAECKILWYGQIEYDKKQNN